MCLISGITQVSWVLVQTQANRHFLKGCTKEFVFVFFLVLLVFKFKNKISPSVIRLILLFTYFLYVTCAELGVLIVFKFQHSKNKWKTNYSYSGVTLQF